MRSVTRPWPQLKRAGFARCPGVSEYLQPTRPRAMLSAAERSRLNMAGRTAVLRRDRDALRAEAAREGLSGAGAVRRVAQVALQRWQSAGEEEQLALLPQAHLLHADAVARAAARGPAEGDSAAPAAPPDAVEAAQPGACTAPAVPPDAGSAARPAGRAGPGGAREGAEPVDEPAASALPGVAGRPKQRYLELRSSRREAVARELAGEVCARVGDAAEAAALLQAVASRVEKTHVGTLRACAEAFEKTESSCARCSRVLPAVAELVAARSFPRAAGAKVHAAVLQAGKWRSRRSARAAGYSCSRLVWLNAMGGGLRKSRKGPPTGRGPGRKRKLAEGPARSTVEGILADHSQPSCLLAVAQRAAFGRPRVVAPVRVLHVRLRQMYLSNAMLRRAPKRRSVLRETASRDGPAAGC